jgi:hypothetical protein
MYQPAWAVWIFHWVVPSLVLKTVSIMRRVHRAFEPFDVPDWDLAKYVELRVFCRCDQFLVHWPCGIEPRLTWLGIWRPLSIWVAWVQSPFGYSGFSQIKAGQVLIGHTAHGLTTWACEAMRYWGFERWSCHASLPVLIVARPRCHEFVPIFHGTASSSKYLPKLCYWAHGQ